MREGHQSETGGLATQGLTAQFENLPLNFETGISPLRAPPPRPPGLCLAAEPPLALRRVDARLRVRRPARHVVDAGAAPTHVPLDAALAHSAGRHCLKALPAAPARWHDKVPSPQAAAARLRRRFMRNVIRRVLPVGHRPARGDHPGFQVGTADPAHRDNSPVAVAIALSALDRPAADALANRPGGGCATSPGLAACAAGLLQLRYVDDGCRIGSVQIRRVSPSVTDHG